MKVQLKGEEKKLKSLIRELSIRLKRDKIELSFLEDKKAKEPETESKPEPKKKGRKPKS